MSRFPTFFSPSSVCAALVKRCVVCFFSFFAAAVLCVCLCVCSVKIFKKMQLKA
jgi:hypothetical protein